MEFLNNIWTALSSENIQLLNLLFIPLSFVEPFFMVLTFTEFLNIKSTYNQKLLYVLLAGITSIISNFFLPSPFNLFFNYIIVYLIIWKIFKLNLINTLVALIFPIIIFSLIGNLTLNPYIKLLNINYEQASTIPIYRIPFLIIMYILSFLAIILIKKLKLGIKLLDNLDNKNKIILMLNFILALITFTIQLIFTFYYIDHLSIIYTLFTFISLLSYFCISIYSLTRTIKLVSTTEQLQTAEEYNKSLSILYDQVKGFKHDFDNIVATIGGFVQTDDINGLKDYYSELQEDCMRINNISTLNPAIINNPGIYSLLSSKYHKADELDIKINLEFFIDLNTLQIKTYELSRILGILLDNAIEAASECEEKIINIQFRNEDKKNRHIIVISNTYANKDINTDEIFEKGKSSKAKHSGLGLWEVRQYMQKNKNLNLFTTKNSKFFTQQLEIYYETKKILILK